MTSKDSEAVEKSAEQPPKEAGAPGEGEEKKAPFLLRLKIPAWLALLLVLVTVLVAWFITGPSRSTAKTLDRTFEQAQQVKISYCLSNAQAEDVARTKARADLRKHLEELGVKDPDFTFVSPCPPSTANPTTISGNSNLTTPQPPQTNR